MDMGRQAISRPETESENRQTQSKSVTAPFSRVSSNFLCFVISQVTVMTAYIVLLSTLSMTLVNLAITTVCEHSLLARFSAKPYIGIILFNPYNSPERLILLSLRKLKAEECSKAYNLQVAKLVFKSIWSDPKLGLHLKLN